MKSKLEQQVREARNIVDGGMTNGLHEGSDFPPGYIRDLRMAAELRKQWEAEKAIEAARKAGEK